MPVMKALDSRYRFENFVTGTSNQLAHASAIKMAGSLGTAHHPLYIYGGIGCGKTHLLQAIGNQFQQENNQLKTCYAHASDYVSDVVYAFENNKFDEFKQHYNSLDLLLIDDVKFIVDKPGVQQEFFLMLNFLTRAKKKVVITDDFAPEDIPGMTPRLISLFSGGLAVAIKPSDVTMRVAFLLQHAKVLGMQIGEEVAYLIAKYVHTDIRTLEGALIMVVAYARFHNRQITVGLVCDAIFTAPFSRDLGAHY